MKILVFGGYGFIGSNFIRKCFERYENHRFTDTIEILNYDKLTYSGNPNNLADIKDKFTFVEGDVADFDKVMKVVTEFQPDFIVNFAAETHVDRSIHVGSIEFINTNVVGVYNILEAVKANKVVRKYIQISTDEVYGMLPNPHDFNDAEKEFYKSNPVPKFNLNSPFKPNVPYSATKASGDCMCNAYFHTWKVPVIVTHCTNNYGPYQYPEKLVPYWATRLMRGEKIPLYGDGLNIRDWIHVDDHIEGIFLALENGEAGKTYNFGADNEKTNIEMAEEIVKIVKGEGARVENFVEYVADRPGHDRRYAMDISEVFRDLGWKPKYGKDEFPKMLKTTVKWYLDNVEWCQEVVNRTGVANAHIDLWKDHKLN